MISFSNFCSDAKVITTDKIENVEAEFAKADNETLVIFDLNDVLLEPIDLVSIQMLNAENDISTPNMKIQLVHPKWPLLITALQSRKIKTLLLTSCGVEKQKTKDAANNLKRNQLLQVGIDFKKLWIDSSKIKFLNIPEKQPSVYNFSNPAFVDGMLFASGAHKGEVLKAFLAIISPCKFKKIIFVDDKRKNLESVENISAAIGVQFIGIEYTYAKTKKRPTRNEKKSEMPCEILLEKKPETTQKEMVDFCAEMINVINSYVIKTCTCLDHNFSEDDAFTAVRRKIPSSAIPDRDIVECIDDFFEVKNKIYDMVNLTCQLKFARKAYAEKVDMNTILDCVNNNLFGYGNFVRISESSVKDPKLSIGNEISIIGCGCIWKDYAKYNVIFNKLFKEKNTDVSFKKLPFLRYKNYIKIIEKIYNFGCDTHALNCKYYIARNFIRHEVPKKVICKIFDFSNNEFEENVKPID
jgi:hypothetical protein